MQTGQKIAIFREKQGLTQKELAEKMYVSRDLVSKWETNKRHPSYKMIIKLSEILCVQPDELLDINERILDEFADCIPDNMNISQADFSVLINGFLETLSKTERFIFIARYYHNKSSYETASYLDMKDGNVRKKLMIIRRKLTAFLKEGNPNG